MSGRPVFQNQFEIRSWKRLNGGGPLGRFSAINGGPQSVLEDIKGRDGSVGSALLVSLIEHLGADATPDTLRVVVSKERVRDCMPSVKASMVMLDRGDVATARELLAMSEPSQEVLHRSIALARILQRAGDMTGAREAAVRAYRADPSCPEAYEILSKVDPEGGWPQRRNISDVLAGRRPESPAGSGRVQGLYQIYYEWYRGNREAASDMLVQSPQYRAGDPEFLLASARMSVDERDWRSADMMFGRLPADRPAFVIREAAEARLSGGDPTGALELFAKADQTLPSVMMGVVRAKAALGERSEMMDALRSYLDSEWAGTEEWKEAVGMLLDMGMDEDAAELLERFRESSQGDPDALTMQSVLMMRRGDLPAALMYAEEAVMRSKGDPAPRVQRARVDLEMGREQRAEKECTGILDKDGSDVGALSVMAEIRRRRGDHAGEAEALKKILDQSPRDPDAMIRLAEALARTGDTGRAADLCRRAARLEGDEGTAVAAVSALVSAGAYGEAVYLCREVEKDHPGNVMLRRLRGNAEYAQGDHLKASVAFAEATGLDPDDPVLWHSKGLADEARGDLESAGEAFSRALSLDPDEPEYWISKAAVQERSGDPGAAVDSLNRAIDAGDTRYALVRKAVIFSSQGKHREALGILDVAIAADRFDVGLLVERMRIQRDMGDYEGALGTFSRIPVGVKDERAQALADECSGLKGSKAEVEAPKTEPVAEPAAPAIPEPVHEPPVHPEPEPVRQSTLEGGHWGMPVRDEEPEPVHEPEPIQVQTTEPIDETIEELVHEPEPALETEPTEEPAVIQDVQEPEPEPVPEPTGNSDQSEEQGSGSKEEAEAQYAMAMSLMEAGDLRGAARAADKAVEADPSNADYLAVKARVIVRSGDADAAISMLSAAIDGNPDEPVLRMAMGEARYAKGDLPGALRDLDAAVNMGMDGADVYVLRGEVLEKTGSMDRALESYSKAVTRDPDRLDLSEKVARMMLARRETMAAYGMVNRILKRDPRRVSAIVLKAEIAQSRKDDAGMMAAYELYRRCPDPGSDSTVRMVRILEETKHTAEARSLVAGADREPADEPVKRYAEKILRRAYSSRSSPTDPDLMGAIGVDASMAAQVRAYITEMKDYGPIVPGTEEFRHMEAKSKEVVMKLRWTDLEGEPRLPLERVYVQGGFRDCDDAKDVISYIHKAMLIDVGRRSDPVLAEKSMRLPKGMSVYDIMRECDLGVFEARIVQSLIV